MTAALVLASFLVLGIPWAVWMAAEYRRDIASPKGSAPPAMHVGRDGVARPDPTAPFTG